MENNQERKLGAGIITMSVIHLAIYILAMVGLAMSFFMRDIIKERIQSAGLDPSVINPTQIAISLILSIIVIIAVILILCKKAIGVYTYFIWAALIIINSIITAGFSISILSSLILPGLMGFFIYKRRYIFGFETKEDI